MFLPRDWFLPIATVVVSFLMITTEARDTVREVPKMEYTTEVEVEVAVEQLIEDVLSIRMGDTKLRADLVTILLDVSQRYNVEEYVVHMAGQILVESGGDPYAVGPTVCLERDEEEECTLYGHAKGLAQIMDVYWKKHLACNGNLFRPENNLSCQAFVLRTMLDRCDDKLLCALNRYWGTTKYRDGPSPYTDKVMKFVNTD